MRASRSWGIVISKPRLSSSFVNRETYARPLMKVSVRTEWAFSRHEVEEVCNEMSQRSQNSHKALGR